MNATRICLGAIRFASAWMIAVALWRGGTLLCAETSNARAPALAKSGATDHATTVAKGRQLFLMNCAHCHARDATGDEGPDLHGVLKSDAKIAAMIKNGVKGKMPKFGAKLSDADVRAIVSYIRSLN